MKGTRLSLQRGVGMIEVLITMLMLATSLMGLAVLQTRSLQYNQDSFFRSQANIMASDVFDLMRIYTSATNTWPEGGTMPRLTDGAQEDLDAWSLRVAESLPEGLGSIACTNATRTCTVTISWTELSAKRASGDENDEEDSEEVADDKQKESSFTYVARL